MLSVEVLFPPGIFGNVQRIAAETLLNERIGMQVKAVALPETRLFLIGEFEPAQPFRTLPEVPPRHHQPQRPTVLRGQRLTVVMGGQQAVRVQQVIEMQVGLVIVIGVGP